MNKWGGINDMPKRWTIENKRVYRLWIDMLRRCYDEEQLSRSKGRAYIDCKVCEDWKCLSVFARDIVSLPGFEQWVTASKMVLDKDILGQGEKEYSKNNCCFIPASVNTAIMNKRHPGITHNAQRARMAKYKLVKDGKELVFGSETEACKFLGVSQCAVAGAWRGGWKCKGYSVIRIGNGADMREKAE